MYKKSAIKFSRTKSKIRIAKGKMTTKRPSMAQPTAVTKQK